MLHLLLSVWKNDSENSVFRGSQSTALWDHPPVPRKENLGAGTVYTRRPLWQQQGIIRLVAVSSGVTDLNIRALCLPRAQNSCFASDFVNRCLWHAKKFCYTFFAARNRTAIQLKYRREGLVDFFTYLPYNFTIALPLQMLIVAPLSLRAAQKIAKAEWSARHRVTEFVHNSKATMESPVRILIKAL